MIFSAQVLKNTAALMTLQIGTYLLPLILIPYLVRILGLEVFGLWMLGLSLVIISRTCVSYGFDLTATRQVAINRENSKAISELYVTVVLVRLLIWLLCLVVLVIAVTLTQKLHDVSSLAMLGMLILVGEIIFPSWLFQGTQKMGLIAVIMLISKTINVALVVLFVNGPDDVLLVPLLEAVTSFTAGAIGAIVAISSFRLKPVKVDLNRIKSEIRDGSALFFAQASVHAYTTVNTIVLGLMLGSVPVAHYTIAEKIYSAVRGLAAPLVQALFPGMALLHLSSKEKFVTTVKRLTIQITLLLTLASLVVICLAGSLVNIVADGPNEQASQTLQILGFALIFATGSFLGPMLAAQQRAHLLLRTTVIGGVIGLVVALPLIALFGTVGAALSFLIVQIYNSLSLYLASTKLVP
jgi:PST family polysaccharide transporter